MNKKLKPQQNRYYLIDYTLSEALISVGNMNFSCNQENESNLPLRGQQTVDSSESPVWQKYDAGHVFWANSSHRTNSLLNTNGVPYAHGVYIAKKFSSLC